MITEKIKEIESKRGVIRAGSGTVDVHVQWAKRGLERKDYFFETGVCTVVKFGNKWILKAIGVQKFELTCDVANNKMDIHVKVGDHREWSLPVKDEDGRWEVLADDTQLYISWGSNVEMGAAYNIMAGSYIVARAT
jgi:hypothetical protein